MMMEGYNGECNYDLETRRLLSSYTAAIDKSSIVFREGWLDAKEECLSLALLKPKYLLLLCLNSNTFARADKATLQQICREFKLGETLKEAIVEWKLQDSFPLIASDLSVLLTRKQHPKLLKSILFVSRIYFAAKTLMRSVILDPSLQPPVTQALQLIEAEANQHEQERLRRKPVPGTSEEQSTTQQKLSAEGPPDHHREVVANINLSLARHPTPEPNAPPCPPHIVGALCSFPSYVAKEDKAVPERTEQRIKEFLAGCPWKKRCCRRLCDLSNAEQISDVSDNLHQDVMLFHGKEMHQKVMQLIEWKKADNKFVLELQNRPSVTVCGTGLMRIFGVTRDLLKTVPNKTNQNTENQMLVTRENQIGLRTSTHVGPSDDASENGLKDGDQQDRPGSDIDHLHLRSGAKTVQDALVGSTKGGKTLLEVELGGPGVDARKLDDGPYHSSGFNVEDAKACRPLFEELSSLLEGNHGGKCLPDKTLWRKLRKNHEAILWSRGLWKEGWQHAESGGGNYVLHKLERPQLLLLCLNTNMLPKADPPTLKQMCKDLQLEEVIKRAVVGWNLQETYPVIVSKDAEFLIQNPQKVLKSVVFISRLYFAMKEIWRKETPEGDMMQVVQTIINIIEEAAKKEQERKSKKRNSISNESEEHPKKRPGRLQRENRAESLPGGESSRGLDQHEHGALPPRNALQTRQEAQEEDSKLGITQRPRPAAQSVAVVPQVATNDPSGNSIACVGQDSVAGVATRESNQERANTGGPLFHETTSSPGQATHSDVASGEPSDTINPKPTGFQAAPFGAKIAKLKAMLAKETERHTDSVRRLNNRCRDGISEEEKRQRDDMSEEEKRHQNELGRINDRHHNEVGRINDRHRAGISDEDNRYQTTVSTIKEILQNCEQEDLEYKKQVKEEVKKELIFDVAL